MRLREGWRIEQVAEVLSQNGLPPYDDLLAVMQSGMYTYTILSEQPAKATVEGYLYPDTYQMDPRWSAREVVDLLIRTMDTSLHPGHAPAGGERGLSTYQVLTLASLVEREAVLAKSVR